MAAGSTVPSPILGHLLEVEKHLLKLHAEIIAEEAPSGADSLPEMERELESINDLEAVRRMMRRIIAIESAARR
jgi:hypothetical protein